MIELGELILKKGGSVDPLKFPNEKFQYYSIPAYDKNEAEIVIGKDIGSSKKIFLPNDVLLSRIVPHIRRCWVIGVNKGYRQIGSSEWITFRSENIAPSFLRFYLMSDDFNSKFLKTIKGVGGSLMRADPSQVAKFKIPLPPLPQQQKIANILDAADSLRQNDKALIAKYDELTQALFLDMFGDPASNSKGWEIKSLGKVCKIQGGYSFKSTDFVKSGVKLVKIANVNFQFLDWEDIDLLPDEFIQKYSNFSLSEGDILMALTRPIIKSLGSVKAVTVKKTDLPALLNQRVARFFPKTEVLSKDFLLRIIYSDFFKNKIEKLSSTSLQPNVSNKQLENIEIFIPPLTLQNQFAERVKQIEEQKAIAQKSLEKSESLFNSLLQKAFKEELV